MIISVAVLAGCASAPTADPIPIAPDVVTVVKWQVPNCDQPPVLTPVKLLPVSWGTLPDADGDTVFTLTPKGYEALSKNMADILGSLKDKNTIAEYYRQCLSDAKDRADKESPD